MNQIAVIVGSNRTNSVSRRLGHWLAPQLNTIGQIADVVDLFDEDLPWLDEPSLPATGEYQLTSTKAWSEKIQKYDAIVFVAPQYNWGYPAVLKNAVDTLYAEWQNLPVATVFFGGHGGFQADLAFSLVLQGLKVDRLPVNLSLNIGVGQIDEKTNDRAVQELLAPYRGEVEQLREGIAQRLEK